MIVIESDIMNKVTYGTTFSQLQCKYLQLDYKETLTNLLDLPFDIIRVCAYWNEIEAEQGAYTFQILDWIIDAISQTDKKIILSVGIKVPRYPEFHLPGWAKSEVAHNTHDIQKSCRKFTEAVLQRYKSNASITYVQIENEPLNNMPIANNRTVDLDFYIGQIHLARSLMRKDQKLLLTNAVNIFPYSWGFDYNKAFFTNLSLADAVGINVYTNIGVKDDKYLKPFPFFWWKLKYWYTLGRKKDTEMWVTEAQSEPWEHGSAVHTSKSSFPSASPEQTETLIDELIYLGYKNILFWGCEQWYWHKKQGRDEWWGLLVKILQKSLK